MKTPSGEQIECPSCGSTALRFSSKPHYMNVVMAFLWRDPIRCSECGFRFYKRALSDSEYDQEFLRKQKGRKPGDDIEEDDEA